MKITGVECLVLDGDYPFIRVSTDECITGIGECFRRQPTLIKALVEDLLTPSIIGRDPTETQPRFNDMQRAGSGLEMGGAVWCAIAGLDIALWDIKGKALGQPMTIVAEGVDEFTNKQKWDRVWRSVIVLSRKGCWKKGGMGPQDVELHR